MDRETSDGWLEKGFLVLTLLILIYAPLATGAVRAFDFLVVQGLVMAQTAVWAVRWFLNPRPRLYWPPLCWGVLAFLVYAVGRYWTAEVEYVARLELTRVVVYGLFFLGVINNLSKPVHGHLLAMTVIGVALFDSFYAIYQFLTGSDYVWNFVRPAGYAHRGSGSYICPNHLAGYLEMVLPMALAYMLRGPSKPLMKVFCGYTSVMIFIGIVATISRGGLAATGLTLVVMLFWFLRQRHFRFQALAILGVIVLVSLPLAVKIKFSYSGLKRLKIKEQLADARFFIWKPAVQMWKDHWWWGVGPDHFDHRYRQYRIAHRDAQTRPRRVHNDYLNTLVDWGLAGGLLAGAVWGLFFMGVFKHWQGMGRAEEPLPRLNRSGLLGPATTLVLGGTFGLMAILLHSLVDFNMHIPANALLAATWLAVASNQFRLATDKLWLGPGRGLRLGVGLVLVLGAWGLGGLGVRRGMETYWMGRAEVLTPCSEQHKAAMEAAFAAEPANYRTAYALGECYRLGSWEGFAGYEEEARLAMKWFERSMEANPYNPNSVAKYGMCLDWIGEREAAGEYFRRAHQLDPGGYYITALVGWHWMQKEDYGEAKKWFERSIELYYGGSNFLASFYLEQVNAKLAEGR